MNGEPNELMDPLTQLVERWPRLQWTYEDSDQRVRFMGSPRDPGNQMQVTIDRNSSSWRSNHSFFWQASIKVAQQWHQIVERISGSTPVDALENAISAKDKISKDLAILD